MNCKHREAMDACCKSIVPRININKLWPRLIENKVFNRDDVNISQWKKNLTNESIVRDIYLTIKTRGPFAFERFLVSLRQSDHEHLADILDGKTHRFHRINENEGNADRGNAANENGGDEVNRVAAVEGIQDDFFLNMHQSDVPLQIQVQKAERFLDGPVFEHVERYPMRSKPRGLVLLITNIHYSNQVPRSSAAHDEQNLKELFEQMGFRVISHVDLTGQELLGKVRAFSRCKEMRKVDSCFVVISSHGSMNAQCEITEIEGVDYTPEAKAPDGKTVLCTDILNCFTTEACPNLAGKPKIFIFQLCRGEKRQISVKVPRHTADTSNFRSSSSDTADPVKISRNETMRNCADMLVAHATLPGHVALRDKVTGSWFIQILCEVFMNYAHETHLQDLLNMVDGRLNVQRTIADECQTLMVTSIGFNKHCYLNPGLFEQP